MLRTAKRYPTQQMWEVAENLNQDIERELITLEEFTTRWYCTYQELASLTNATVSAVKTWHSSRQLKPDFEALYRLTRVHAEWMKIKNSSR